MNDFVESVVKALVDNPDEVNVTEVFGERGAVYEIRVAQADLGKVIGKGGQTVKAMRALMTAIAAKHGKRVGLEIID